MRKHPTKRAHSRHLFSAKMRHPESLRNGIHTAEKIAQSFLKQHITVFQNNHILSFPHGLPSSAELQNAIKKAYLQTVVAYEVDPATNCIAF